MPPEVILRTRNLGKRYRNRWAVKNLNLEVHRGDVFGFLGPNGAGKSTTIRMLLSLIRPTEGDVELFGLPLSRKREEALKPVGGIVEKPDFYLYLSALKNLEIVGALNGGSDRSRMMQVLESVGLASRAHDKVKTYSHGMKQRLGIAQALLSNPELVILDEPTSGLDPQGMKEVRDLILNLAHGQKKTVILSSHLLNEIELVANRMAIISKGELVIQGEVNRLIEEGEKYVLVSAEPVGTVTRVLKKCGSYVQGFERKGGEFRVLMDFQRVPDLTAALVKASARVNSLIPRRSLEDYFLALTEQSEGT